MTVISESTGLIRITQRNRPGAGGLATGAWWLSIGLVGIVVFVGAILLLLALRAASGQGAPEDIVGFILLPPLALALLAAAISELSVALPRRIDIDGVGIHFRYSTWPWPRPKFLPRIEGQRAGVQKLRLRNSVTYASGRVSHAPIRKDRFMVRYGSGWIGPFDEDQVEKLADTINIALEKTAP